MQGPCSQSSPTVSNITLRCFTSIKSNTFKSNPRARSQILVYSQAGRGRGWPGVIYPKAIVIKCQDTHSYTLYMHRSFYQWHALLRFTSMGGEGRSEMGDSQIIYTGSTARSTELWRHQFFFFVFQHFHDHISAEHDEKPSHTKFDMNWFMVARDMTAWIPN